VARRDVVICAMGLGLLPGAPACAQALQAPIPPRPDLILPRLQQPQLKPLPPPEFAPSTPAPSVVLPPVPLAEPGDRLASQLRVTVRQVRIVGSTIFSAQELAQVAAPYENRVITSEELQQLRDALTLYYVERGYINSGATIPDQQVVDGIVTVQIIEGELTRVEVTGNERLKSAYISGRVINGEPNRPLNLAPLQSRLLLLDQNPLIERLEAQLVPGDTPGEAVLRLNVIEARPYFATLAFSNDNPTSTGSNGAVVWLGHRNLSGWGDALTLGLGLTEGSRDLNARYVIPVSARGTELGLLYWKTTSEVIEEPFNQLDIKSSTETAGISLTHPFYLTPNRQFSAGVSLQYRHNETELLGFPFSLYPGAKDGESTVTVLRFNQDWLDRRRDQVFAARSTFSFGTEALGASVGPDPDGRFVAWLGQCQWAKRLGERGAQALLRADVQLADNRLLPMEQFAVGGIRTVRGYPVNTLVRDNAVVMSGELRQPLYGLADALRGFEVAAFVDYAQAWNHGGSTPPPRDISSVGLGVRWDPNPNLHAELYWGYRLRKIENPTDNLLDYGINFALVWHVL